MFKISVKLEGLTFYAWVSDGLDLFNTYLGVQASNLEAHGLSADEAVRALLDKIKGIAA